MINPSYRLPGTPLLTIGTLVYDELGSCLVRRHNERFAGKEGIVFSETFRKDAPITGSNLPRALSLAELLSEETKGTIRLLSLADTVRYWEFLPDKDTTYADTSSFFFDPTKTESDILFQRLCEIDCNLGVPVVASGLTVKPADNPYGFTFDTTMPHLCIMDSLAQKKDVVLCYEDGLQVGDLHGKGGDMLRKGLATFGRIHRGWTMGLYAGFYHPLHADEAGRFQVLQTVSSD